MRTTGTLWAGAWLIALGLTGCGQSAPTPAEKPKESPATDAKPMAGTDAAATPPAVPADPYVFDPAKQVLPPAPAAGRLANEPFAPEASAVGDTLSFKAGKEGTAAREVSFTLSPKLLAAATAGSKVTVKPDTAAGDDVPQVTITVPGPNGTLVYTGGYALTLDLGKREKGRVAGKVYLALPNDDKGVLDGTKSYLAGTFLVEWQRAPTTPPGSEDVPFVRGKISVVGGPADPTVKVGFVRAAADSELSVNRMEAALAGAGRWSRLGATAVAESKDEKGTGLYEHVGLTPGRYLCFAALPTGPVAWKWLTVEVGSRLTADLAIDAAATGTAVIALAPDEKKELYLVPTDGPDGKLSFSIAAAAGLDLGLTKMPADGKATFERLAPGSYEVWSAVKLGTLEIKRGETATLDATGKK